MDAYLLVTNERVTGISNTPSPGGIKITVPDDHEVLRNPLVFKYASGQLIKDTAFQQEKMKEEDKKSSAPSLQTQIDNLKKQNSDLAYMLMLKGVL